MTINHKHVCFVIPGFGEGGAQRQCIKLINELKKHNDFNVTLIYFYEGIYWDELEKSGVNLVKIEVSSLYSPLTAWKVIKTINYLTPDVVFSWLHSTDVYVGLYKLFNGKAKWLLAERNSKYPFNFRFILRGLLATLSSSIACNSIQGAKYWIDRGFNENKIYVIKNISPNIEISQRDEINNLSDLLYVGRIEPQKNILYLTDLFCYIVKKNSDINCLIVGNGSLKEIAYNHVSGANCLSNIQFIPFQRRIVDSYISANVLVNISFHEGAPNTVLEAISMDKRVVVSYIPEHVDILGKDYPYYIELGSSISSASEVILRALQNPVPGDDYIQAKKYLSQMEPIQVCAEYIKIFNSLSSYNY